MPGAARFCCTAKKRQIERTSHADRVTNDLRRLTRRSPCSKVRDSGTAIKDCVEAGTFPRGNPAEPILPTLVGVGPCRSTETALTLPPERNRACDVTAILALRRLASTPPKFVRALRLNRDRLGFNLLVDAAQRLPFYYQIGIFGKRLCKKASRPNTRPALPKRMMSARMISD
jgi:hypothetical protein